VKYSSGRNRPVVTADGEGVANHVGALLLTEMADWSGITDGFSDALNRGRQRRSAHDPGVILRQLAVTIADGGDCVTDLSVLRGQESLFGPVASDVYSLAYRGQAGSGSAGGVARNASQARERAWNAGPRRKAG